MIFRFIIAASLLFPLIGVLMVEQGWYGGSISRSGYFNMGSIAFGTFVALTIAFVWIARKVRFVALFGAQPTAEWVPSPGDAGRRVVVLMIPMAAFVLFGLGGLNTIVGDQSSGGFRASLGSLGAVGYLIAKYYAPSLMAYLLALRIGSVSTIQEAARRIVAPDVIVSAICLVLIALSFGYKSGAVVAFIPAAIIVFWHARTGTVLALFAAAMIVVVAGYFWFGWQSGSLLYALVYRMFVLHGDISWGIWEMYVTGVEFPDYWPTLLPILGDHIFSAFTGITRADPSGWISTHFSLLATHLAGFPAKELVAQNHNGSAHVFSEALIAGGIPGLAIFAAMVGTAIALVYSYIENKLAAANYASASIAASYAIMALFAWIIGGGILEVAHISVLFALATLAVMMYWVSGRLIVFKALSERQLPYLRTSPRGNPPMLGNNSGVSK